MSKVKRPFFWSIVLLGFALLAFQAAAVLFQRGLRRAAFVWSGIGLLLLLLELCLFLPVLVRNAFPRAVSLRVFRVTAGGMVFLLLILLIALAAINTGNNLLYMLLSFMIAAIVISGLVSRSSLARLDISLDYQDFVFAGETTSYRIRLSNRKRRRSSFSIGVEGTLLNETCLAEAGLEVHPRDRHDPARLTAAGVPLVQAAGFFPHVAPRETAERVFHIRFPRRGAYRIDGLRVTTSFPFGFFRKGKTIGSSGRMMVYPALLDTAEFLRLLDWGMDEVALARIGHGPEILFLRDYVSGEDVRRIHWKATARTGRPITREHAAEVQEHILILVDETVDGPTTALRERYERVVSFLATLLLDLHEKGFRVSLALSRTTAGYPTDAEDVQAGLEALASSYLRERRDNEPADALENPDSTAVAALAEETAGIILCSFRPENRFLHLEPFSPVFWDLRDL